MKEKEMKTKVNLLDSIKNPVSRKYEISHRIPEFTFLGKRDSDGNPQRDYATIIITYVPDAKLIELKALKKYKETFTNKLFSYESLINVIFDDLLETYKPHSLIVIMETKPRGGISSRLAVAMRNCKPKDTSYIG